MAQGPWNFLANPPIEGAYSEEEVYRELVHSAKAYFVCHAPALALSKCREKPNGKTVHPEDCVGHAQNVFNCYQQVRKVPEKCQEVFSNVEKCLKTRGKCEDSMKEYVRCEHPAYKVFESYH